MITNREEVLEKAFKVFVKMNYEKALQRLRKPADYQGQASSTTFHTN